jgi:hypothetical protein
MSGWVWLLIGAGAALPVGVVVGLLYALYRLAKAIDDIKIRPFW